MILAQVDPSTVNSVVTSILQIGITGIAALVFGYLYFKANKKNSETAELEIQRLVDEKEKAEERIQKERENSDTQTNMLWTELKKGKDEEIEKYNILTQSLNETQQQTVKALQENALVIKSNTDVMKKNMDIMERFINVLISKIE